MTQFDCGLTLELPSGRPVLSLDVGDARIGVACSDPTLLMATPVVVVERRAGAAVERVAALASEHDAALVVVGMPLNMDGSMGTQANRVKRFAEELAAAMPVRPLCFWDERLSTVEAHAIRLRSGVGKKKRQAPVDAVSAAVILQGWLDARRAR